MGLDGEYVGLVGEYVGLVGAPIDGANGVGLVGAGLDGVPVDGVQTVLQGMGLVVFLLMAYKVYTVSNALCLDPEIPKCDSIKDGRFWSFSISRGVRPYLLFADGKMVVCNSTANAFH